MVRTILPFGFYGFCLSVMTTVMVGSSPPALAETIPCDLSLTEEQLRGSLLDGLEIDSATVEQAYRTSMQTFSLLDLLKVNPAENVAVQMPRTVMNAAQYLYAMVMAQGKEEILTPFSREPIPFYPALSLGGPASSGRRAVGQFRELGRLVDNMQAGALGTRAGQYRILFRGPPGTGKSEIGDVIPGLYAYNTAQPDSVFRFPSLEFYDLDKIDLPGFTGKYLDTHAAPSDASPVAVLPDKLRDLVTKMVSGRIEELTGTRANPKYYLDSQSREIRQAIFTYYQKQKGSDLTVNEMMAALNKHVRGRMVVVDKKYKSIIEPQGQDLDVGSLFAQPNAVNRNLIGPSEPSAWFLTGAFPRAGGKYLGLDEVAKNGADILAMLLGVLESGRMAGAGPGDDVDIYYTLFTNDVDFDAMIAKGHKALANRAVIVPLRGALFPSLIEDLLYYSVANGLEQQKITTIAGDEQPWQPYQWTDVMPLPRHQNPKEKFLGPEGRYRLQIGVGPSAVFIAPHSGRLLADLVGATRYITDPARLRQLSPDTDVVNLNEFRDPLARLRAYRGESALDADSYFNLVDASELLEEGSSHHPGILTRDMLKIWQEVITRASLKQNENTVTPSLILQVIEEQLNKDAKGGVISAASNDQRLAWKELMDRLRDEWLRPVLRRDVMESYGAGDLMAKQAYYKILAQLDVLVKTPGAMSVNAEGAVEVLKRDIKYHFEGRSHELNAADIKAIESVAKNYKNATGSVLSVHQIGHLSGLMAGRNRTADADEDLRHNALYGAVVEHYAVLNVQSGQLALIVAALNGQTTGVSETVRLHAEDFLAAMRLKGYNDYSARVAAQAVVALLEDQTPVQNPPPQQ